MNATIELLANKGGGSVDLDLDFRPGIALLTINHAKRHNALSGKMMVEFHQAITQLERNTISDRVALIVMGAGQTSFCAGLDLTFAREHVTSPQISLAMNELMHDAVERLSRLELITVAVVNGGAIGGGSEMITGFDFVCMSENAFVHFVQTRMGVSSPWGGMRRLVSLVGRKKALRWMAGGAKLSAQECLQGGLADVVVKDEKDTLSAGIEFLKPFLMNEKTGGAVSPNAVRGMKKLLLRQIKDNDWEHEKEIFASTVFSKL